MKNMLVKSLLVMVIFMLILPGCTAIQVGGEFILNPDGSGSRTIILHLYDSDNNDGFGNAILFSRLRGNALRDRIVQELENRLGDISWLNVTVHMGSGLQDHIKFITLAFNFDTFDDYVDKMTRLAMFGGDRLPPGSRFVPPTLTRVPDTYDTYRFRESAESVLWTVRPLFLALIDDPTVFDVTAGGTNTQADIEYHRSFGLEMRAVPMIYTFGDNFPNRLVSGMDVNELFSMSGLDVDWVREPTELVIHYNFDGNVRNHGTAGAMADLVLGEGSSMSSITFAPGIRGQGLRLDGSTYLRTPASFAFSELTISFFAKPERWQATDTGSNTILVNNSLGALGPGALDIIFLKELDEPYQPVFFLAKSNGTNWMAQDQMRTETFFNNRLNEWRHIAIVYENDYDEFGDYEVSYITLFIDGVMYGRMEQFHAAGLPKRLGIFADNDRESGFAVGGYYEAGVVKRGFRGVIDEIKVFNGPLSHAEILEIFNASPVSRIFDPECPTNISPVLVRQGTAMRIILPIIIVLLAVVVFIIVRRKRG